MQSRPVVDDMKDPTPHPQVNLLLEALLQGVQSVLGSHFIAMYLDGSLAGGDFDQDSDIDFVVVTDEEITAGQFAALQALHDRLAAVDSIWAIQLEGFYISQQALKRYEPGGGLVPNIERGQGERLKLVPLDQGWQIHRYILRERGITLVGPAPYTMIDQVSAGQLRQAMRFILSEWAAQMLLDPWLLQSRGYQTYTVLSLCRILYTLQQGEVASKRAAARWAQEALGERWVSLIESAWDGRRHPDQRSSPEQVQDTLAFIRFALEKGR